MKYQFTIRLNNNKTNNSAATKAMVDCNELFLKEGYRDYSLYYSDTSNRIKYGLSLVLSILKFYLKIENNSVIATQYPLLNNTFKYFIKAARFKNAKIFCVIHDIESLRLGALDKKAVSLELSNLNYYDCLIVHNEAMMNWLRDNGVTIKMVPLGIFDYLLKQKPEKNNSHAFSNTIVFAGNLEKSKFIYSINKLGNWKFNIYGPNYLSSEAKSPNVVWRGVYSPEEVVYQLDGDFGLIWDGNSMDECDEILGNYLKYNNPHKFSLYIAAGLPVIAPKNSAIGKVISENKIGLLVDNLNDLNGLVITENDYRIFKENCNKIRNKIINGEYLLNAIKSAERAISFA